MYSEITKTVIKNSLEFAVKEKADVSINISFSDINDNEVKEFIYNALEEKPYDCKVTFKLLENEVIKDYKEVEKFVKTIKRFGCFLAIDDFGSGYSSYEQILKFMPDILKIDGTLIKNIESDKNSEMIVRSIVVLAKEAGIKTVAEFVHNENIDKIITEMGIDYGQGFYYAPPKDFS